MSADHDSFDGAEFELQQLVQELHDGPVQLMVGAKMLCEAVDVTDPDARATHQRILELLARAIAETRALLHRFGPPDLEETDWQAALRRWLALVVEPNGPNLQFDIAPAALTISDQAELAAYRISQESIYNALRHSGAKQIQLEANCEAQTLRVRIADDGRGFDRDLVPRDRRGLIGMQQRARSIGGECQIESTPGRGTVITLTLPLSR